MKQFALSFKKISLKLFVFLLWEKRIFPQSRIVHFGNGPRSWCHSHKFIQSHIEERRLPPLPYMHYGTPFLRPSAYKVRVGGVSSWCGIEQIRKGGICSAAHSQSEQYLTGERFVPPTPIIHFLSFSILQNMVAYFEYITLEQITEFIIIT